MKAMWGDAADLGGGRVRLVAPRKPPADWRPEPGEQWVGSALAIMGEITEEKQRVCWHLRERWPNFGVTGEEAKRQMQQDWRDWWLYLIPLGAESIYPCDYWRPTNAGYERGRSLGGGRSQQEILDTFAADDPAAHMAGCIDLHYADGATHIWRPGVGGTISIPTGPASMGWYCEASDVEAWRVRVT